MTTDMTGFSVGVATTSQKPACDSAGNWSSGGPFASAVPTPPDPQLIAPPLDTTVSTTIGSATAFLYTGPNAIQTGVTAGTISATRAAVVRGLVRARAAQSVPGVEGPVPHHPRDGDTRSGA